MLRDIRESKDCKQRSLVVVRVNPEVDWCLRTIATRGEGTVQTSHNHCPGYNYRKGMSWATANDNFFMDMAPWDWWMKVMPSWSSSLREMRPEFRKSFRNHQRPSLSPTRAGGRMERERSVCDDPGRNVEALMAATAGRWKDTLRGWTLTSEGPGNWTEDSDHWQFQIASWVPQTP